MQARSIVGRALIAGILAVGLGAAGGCAGYASYPPVEGSVADRSPNSSLVIGMTWRSLEWVTTRFPVQGEYVVNLAEGTTLETANEILRRLDDPKARLVGHETMELPSYHVARVWVRGTRAEVDVLRPIPDLSRETGEPVHQGVTLTLRGGTQPWRVESSRLWTIGTIETPELNVLIHPEPAPEEPELEPEGDPDVEWAPDDVGGWR